jgi:Subtilase family
LQNNIKKHLQDIIDLDVPIVMATGTFGQSSPDVNSYPQLFAMDIEGIMLVGATNNEGALTKFSQGGPLVSAWAPGDNVAWMSGSGNTEVHKSGTSFAAPKVAGVIAYIMGLTGNGLKPGSVAKDVKDRISILPSRVLEAKRLNGTVLVETAAVVMASAMVFHAAWERSTSTQSQRPLLPRLVSSLLRNPLRLLHLPVRQPARRNSQRVCLRALRRAISPSGAAM